MAVWNDNVIGVKGFLVPARTLTSAHVNHWSVWETFTLKVREPTLAPCDFSFISEMTNEEMTVPSAASRGHFFLVQV